MIEMTPLMRDLLASAADDGVPCLVGTASKDGHPQISPKGSLAVFDAHTLSFWERSFRSAAAAISENPRVVVYYRNAAKTAEIPYRSAAMRFYGSARIVDSGAERDRAWELTIPFEQERDPEKKGVAVLIDVDRIEELSGAIIMARDK
ncbi:MAG: pyridoxamine 5'-phosphate oxidase family protein [Burkholderiales bacterium]